MADKSGYRFGLRLCATVMSLVALGALGQATGLLDPSVLGVDPEQAKEYIGGRLIEYGALSLRFDTTAAAVFLASTLAALSLSGKLPPDYKRLLVVIGSASSLIAFLSLSRNSVVSVGATVGLTVMGVLIHPHRLGLAQVFKRSLVAVGAVLMLAYLAVISGVASQTVTAFWGRAVLSLSGQGANDSSIVWRSIEDAAAERQLGHNWVLGVGLGLPYRNHYSFEPFTGDDGTYYIHNNYLFVLVNLGFFLGIVALGVIIVPTALTWLSAHDRWSLSVSSGLLATFLICWVTPVLNQRSSSAVVGAAIGALLLYHESSGEYSSPPKGMPFQQNATETSVSPPGASE